MPEKYTDEELQFLSEEERAGLESKEEDSLNLEILKEVAGNAVAPLTEEPEEEPVAPEPVKEPAASDPAAEPDVTTPSETVEPEPEEVLAETVETPYDFKTADKKYLVALQDGNDDEALTIREEIRSEEAKLYRRQAREEVTFNQEVGKVTAVVLDAIKEYPFLDDKSKQKNQEAIEEDQAIRDFLISKKNMSPDAAIREAVKRVGPRYTTAAQKTTTPTPPPLQPRPGIQTLANVPVVESNNPDNGKWAALDRMEGEAYEAAVERLTPSESKEFLSR